MNMLRSTPPLRPCKNTNLTCILQATLRCARNVFCTDQQDGAAMPFGDDRGLARFRVLAQLGLRHAHRGCLGGAGLLCPWLPASLQVKSFSGAPVRP